MNEQEAILKISEKIKAALDRQQFQEAVETILSLHLADQAEVFNNLEEYEQEVLLKHLDIPSTAHLFDELEDDETLEAASALTMERLADALDEMEPDEAADLLGDLHPEQVSEALAQMDDPDDVIPLLHYSDETAGGRMTTTFLALRPQTTADQEIRFLRRVSTENDVPYYLFVVDRNKRLDSTR